jgi:hypothetical protein
MDYLKVFTLICNFRLIQNGNDVIFRNKITFQAFQLSIPLNSTKPSLILKNLSKIFSREISASFVREI